jgi:hypothetical protein
MDFLQKRWRSGPIYRYFDGLEPIDRATFLIAIVLALAVGLCASQIFRAGAIGEVPVIMDATLRPVPA